jgi:hypothetical protein
LPRLHRGGTDRAIGNMAWRAFWMIVVIHKGRETLPRLSRWLRSGS